MIQWAVFAEHHKGLAPMWKPSVVSYWYMPVTAGLGIRDKRIARTCSWNSTLGSVGKNKMVKHLKKLSWRQSLESVSCFMGECTVHTHTDVYAYWQAHAGTCTCAHKRISLSQRRNFTKTHFLLSVYTKCEWSSQEHDWWISQVLCIRKIFLVGLK